MSRPRVVHVITGLTLGGAERHVQTLVRSSEVDASVVALYEGGAVADELRAEGHDVEVWSLASVNRLGAIRHLAAHLRRVRPDVVHVHLLSAQAIGIPAARLARVPVIVSSEHSIMADTVEGLAVSRGLKLSYRVLERLASHTVAVSPTTARRLTEWGVAPSRVSVVDLGVELDALAFSGSARAAVRAELGLREDEIVIGAVGRLAPVKRFVEMVTALAPLLRDGGHRLVIVGHGALRSSIEQAAAELGVARHVLLTGPRPDVARVYNAFDLFLSPSRDETFGLAVVEAVANGLPTAYAQSPALKDLGIGSPGLLTLPAAGREADEASALLAAVRALGPMGRLPVPAPLRRYDVASGVRGVEDVYAELLGPQPAGSTIT